MDEFQEPGTCETVPRAELPRLLRTCSAKSRHSASRTHLCFGGVPLFEVLERGEDVLAVEDKPPRDDQLAHRKRRSGGRAVSGSERRSSSKSDVGGAAQDKEQKLFSF